MIQNEPPLEFIQQGYGDNFYPKQVTRLGDNMFLITYTRDRKGRGVRYRSIVYWGITNSVRSSKDRWVFLGTVKRNRTRWGEQAINVFAADWEMKHRIDAYFLDT